MSKADILVYAEAEDCTSSAESVWHVGVQVMLLLPKRHVLYAGGCRVGSGECLVDA